MKHQHTGITRIIKAFTYSMDGFKATYKSEAAFRQEVWLAAVLIPLSIILPFSWRDTVTLISAMLLVLIAEMLNSAIEAAIDRISLEKHPLSKQAKDIGSAVVLISLLNLALFWIVICYTQWLS